MNEILVSLYLYIMLTLADLSAVNTFRHETGWCLLAVVFTSVGLNFTKFFFNVIVIINMKYQKWQ